MRHRITVDGAHDGARSTPHAEAAAAEQEATGTNAPGADDSTPSGPAPDAPAGLEALQARVAELEKQVEQERGQYLRTLADFQNYRRRSEEQKGEIARFANSEMVVGLLPVLDNFERALAAAEKSQSYEALMGGVALTLRQLQDFLTRNGVEPIEAAGQPFDPSVHEAVARVEGTDHPEDTVVDELQRGYKMNDRVLRPARVRVAGNG